MFMITFLMRTFIFFIFYFNCYVSYFLSFKSKPLISIFAKQSNTEVLAPLLINQILNITILEVTNLGQGVGKYELPDGSNWIILVPYVIENEFVTVEIINNYKSYSFGTVLQILIPSQNRVIPKCQYFQFCGGCHYQHIDIEHQKQMKRKHVLDLLLKYSGVKDIVVDNTIGSSQSYNYRSKITPHLIYDSNLTFGFQSSYDDSIINIDECVIATDKINNKISEIHYEATTKGITYLKNISTSSSYISNQMRYTILLRDSDDNVTYDSNALIKQTVNSLKYEFIASDFFQNNIYILSKLVDYISNQLISGNPSITEEASYLVDTYCGVGLFSIAIAKYFKNVYGIDVNEQSIKQANINAISNNVSNIEFYCGISQNIFQNIKHIPNKKTVILLDPPRKGCSESFLKQLVNFKPLYIIYVSCDPLSQANDMKILLKKGYLIRNITPFDFFPHTRHIENVIIMKLKT